MNMMWEDGAIIYVCGGGARKWNLPVDVAFVVRLPWRGIVLINHLFVFNHHL